MSRSGYTDDYDDPDYNNALELYRGNVDRAVAGKRGQALLREMAEALDAMPEKKLIEEALEYNGQHCALGIVGAKRGIDFSKIQDDAPEQVARAFGIATCLAAEIAYINDDAGPWVGPHGHVETPEERWKRVRAWVGNQIKKEA